jgi:hypothetical protein
MIFNYDFKLIYEMVIMFSEEILKLLTFMKYFSKMVLKKILKYSYFIKLSI